MGKSDKPRKIAVLGSGAAALAAVFELTNRDNWQKEYDITVYQVGWKAGGKLSNGRNVEQSYRDQEHGYHILFGFYNNVFNMMMKVYDELGRPDDMPMCKFAAETQAEEHDPANKNRFAMRRKNTFYVVEKFQGEFKTVEVTLPAFDGIPGDDPMGILELLKGILKYLTHFNLQMNTHHHEGRIPPVTGGVTPPGFSNENRIGDRLSHVANRFEKIEEHIGLAPNRGNQGAGRGNLFNKLVDQLEDGVVEPLFKVLRNESHELMSASERANQGLVSRAEHLMIKALTDEIIALIRMFVRDTWFFLQGSVHTNWHSYLSWVSIDLLGSVLIGLLQNNVLSEGLDVLNTYNFYEWIQDNGAVAEGSLITAQSSFVEFAYVSLLSYEKGNTTSPITEDKPIVGDANVEAGTVLRFFMKMLLDYRGAVTWEFQVNAGDAIIAPLYEVLRNRGVTFEFFSNVKDIQLNEHLTGVEKITVGRQVKLKNPDVAYQPLISVKGLNSWSATPDYNQIKPDQAKVLQEQNINLESYWADNPFEVDETLEYGIHFDDVILGISLGGLKYISEDLKRISSWRVMLEKIHTVRTFALQTWMIDDIKQLGWDKGDRPIANTGINSTLMRADSTQIVNFEDWNPDNSPKDRTYYGGPFPDDPNEPDAPAPGYQATQDQAALERAQTFMNEGASAFWPNSVKNDQFDWNLVQSEYHVATIDPSSRYVQALTGTWQYRLASRSLPVENLILAGDWTVTPLNCGCFEGATMSGLLAAESIMKQPSALVGGQDRKIIVRHD